MTICVPGQPGFTYYDLLAFAQHPSAKQKRYRCMYVDRLEQSIAALKKRKLDGTAKVLPLSSNCI